jgi:hypothetical protein
VSALVPDLLAGSAGGGEDEFGGGVRTAALGEGQDANDAGVPEQVLLRPSRGKLITADDVAGNFPST